MKGIELPINILVIVAIAVIVLLGLVALYFVGIGPFSVNTAQDAAKNEGCREFLNLDCVEGGLTASVNYDVKDKNPANPDPDNTLGNLADQYYGCNGADDLACVQRLCGCPGII